MTGRAMAGSQLFWSVPVYVVLFILTNKVAIASDSLISEFDLPAEISAANDIVVDRSGNVWFSEKVGKNLIVFNPESEQFRAYPLPESWGNVGTARITYSPGGNIWFSVRRWAESVDKTNLLGKFNLSDHSFRKYTLPAQAVPEELIVDHEGMVWFLVPDENKLYHFDPDSGSLKPHPIPTPNSYPRAISLDSAGNIWFAEANANKIARFNPTDTIFSEFEIPTRFANPGEITIDAEGKVWFVELTANRLGVFYPLLERFDEAIIPTLRGMPNDIETDSEGNLWFLEYRGNKIGFFNPFDATFREYNIPAFNSQPGALAIDRQREILWFSESSTEVKKLGRLSITAALMAKSNHDAVNSQNGINNDNSAIALIGGDNTNRSVYFLLLVTLVIACSLMWYSRMGLKR